MFASAAKQRQQELLNRIEQLKQQQKEAERDSAMHLIIPPPLKLYIYNRTNTEEMCLS